MARENKGVYIYPLLFMVILKAVTIVVQNLTARLGLFARHTFLVEKLSTR